MSFKTDAQIAREADIRPIREIAAKLGIACIIDIQPGDAITTPIDYRRQQSAAQQKQAEADFHNHPQVQAAQAVFGDSLRVDNIQPTNPSQT